jgi:hypothetical protein
MDYGSVTKVIDAVKIAGASPISLQIDDLNWIRKRKSESRNQK